MFYVPCFTQSHTHFSSFELCLTSSLPLLLICLYCFFFFVATIPFFLSSYEGCYEVVAGEKFKFRLEMMVEEQCATDLFPTLKVFVVCLFSLWSS
jgi:hypothetical protein